MSVKNEDNKIIPVFIEVSKCSRMKYEWCKKKNCLVLDRVLHSSVVYPYNYGFMSDTLCGDGDALDVLIYNDNEMIPGCLVMVRPIGFMIMEDEKGMDEKVLGVIDQDPRYNHINDIEDIPDHNLKEITHFFETYKQLEKEKWVKVDSWKGKKETLQLIKKTQDNFEKNI